MDVRVDSFRRWAACSGARHLKQWGVLAIMAVPTWLGCGAEMVEKSTARNAVAHSGANSGKSPSGIEDSSIGQLPEPGTSRLGTVRQNDHSMPISETPSTSFDAAASRASAPQPSAGHVGNVGDSEGGAGLQGSAETPRTSLGLGQASDEPIENEGSPVSSVPRFWIGIQSEPAPKVLLDQFGLQCGLVVEHVIRGGPSDGWLLPSDLIYGFNGQPLTCKSKLCSVIADSGSQLAVLQVIRKAERIEVAVQPQPFVRLSKDRIVQYTLLDGEKLALDSFAAAALESTNPRSGRNTLGLASGTSTESAVEKLRLFVVQPSLLVQSSTEATATIEGEGGQFELERVASFRTDEQGRRVLVVQENGILSEYLEEEVGSLCDELRQLFEMIEEGP